MKHLVTPAHEWRTQAASLGPSPPCDISSSGGRSRVEGSWLSGLSLLWRHHRFGRPLVPASSSRARMYWSMAGQVEFAQCIVSWGVVPATVIHLVWWLWRTRPQNMRERRSGTAPVLPVSPEAILAVSAWFKASRYKSRPTVGRRTRTAGHVFSGSIRFASLEPTTCISWTSQLQESWC